MTALTDRIDDALTRPDPDDAIRLVKDAVHEEVIGLDGGLQIEQTQFFNHTFYPDFVLRWHERGEAQERPVFLRLESGVGTLGPDLRMHGESRPVFVGVLDHREAPLSDNASEAQLSDDEPNTGGSFIAEASALDVLEDFAREGAGQTVATSALVRGGHGRLSEGAARELGEQLDAGFGAAAEARDPEAVLEAFGAISDLVDLRRSAQLQTHLQLMWLGSGGDLGDLFGSGRLAIESLSELQLREVLDRSARRPRQVCAPMCGRDGRVVRPCDSGDGWQVVDGC